MVWSNDLIDVYSCGQILTPLRYLFKWITISTQHKQNRWFSPLCPFFYPSTLCSSFNPSRRSRMGQCGHPGLSSSISQVILSVSQSDHLHRPRFVCFHIYANGDKHSKLANSTKHSTRAGIVGRCESSHRNRHNTEPCVTAPLISEFMSTRIAS